MNIFKDYDKQLVRTCELQQELIFKLALVSNYSIENLISLFAQGWYLAPPKNKNDNILDKLKRGEQITSEEVMKEIGE